MVKIKKKYEPDPNYQLMTSDYSSLQARLAAIDTAMNDSGLDPVLFNLYRKDSDIRDMHCSTAYSTFGEATGLEITDYEDENGKIWSILDNQEIEIERDGQKIVVLGADLLDTDIILSYV